MVSASGNTTVRIEGGVTTITGNQPAVVFEKNGGSMTVSGGTITTGEGATVSPITIPDGVTLTLTSGEITSSVKNTPAITIAEGATLSIPENSTVVVTANSNDAQAISLASGATVTKGSTTVTVASAGNGAESYVDNYGNIILAANVDDEGNVTASRIITADGTDIESDENGEPLTIRYDTAGGTTTTSVTVPAGAKVDGEEWSAGGSVESDGNEATSTPAASGLTLSDTSVALTVGGEKTLTATLQPAGAEGTVTWSSSNDNVATVDSTGKVTAAAVGTATITATVGEGANAVTAKCEVTVSPVPVPATSITLSPASVYVGSSVQLSAAVEPANSTDTIAWTSSDENIATVDANGVVTGVASGTVTITATANDSVSAACVVTVQAPYVPTPPVTPVQPVNPTPDPDPAPDPAPTPGVWTNPYADVSTADWYYDAVAYVAAKSLMTGTTASTFAPNDTMTRAMVWTVLARMEGQSVEGGSPWYALAQSWAMNAAVSNGTGPNDSITREQLVTMLYRQAGSPEVGVSELAKLGQFSDGEAVSDWAQSAMAWAVANGILTGEAGALNPQASATRGQVAAILMRYCQQ